MISSTLTFSSCGSSTSLFSGQVKNRYLGTGFDWRLATDYFDFEQRAKQVENDFDIQIHFGLVDEVLEPLQLLQATVLVAQETDHDVHQNDPDEDGPDDEGHDGQIQPEVLATESAEDDPVVHANEAVRDGQRVVDVVEVVVLVADVNDHEDHRHVEHEDHDQERDHFDDDHVHDFDDRGEGGHHRQVRDAPEEQQKQHEQVQQLHGVVLVAGDGDEHVEQHQRDRRQVDDVQVVGGHPG